MRNIYWIRFFNGTRDFFWMKIFKLTNSTQVEVPEIFSAEQCCSWDLTFFSAVQKIWKTSALFNATSELISSDFLWIRAVLNWTLQRCFRENQCCPAQIYLAVRHWSLNSADSALIYSESALILTHGDDNAKMWLRSYKWWKRLKRSIKWHSWY